MSARARAMQTLYRMGKVTEAGVRQSVNDGVLTAEEYQTITGQEYPA